jgi:signal transduction histidine kinase
VQLHCPRNQDHLSQNLAYLKNNAHFSQEDLRLGKEIVLPLRRIIRTIQLAEQQLWLVNEVGHSLAQPLQVLRSHAAKPIRALFNPNVNDYDIREMNANISQSFEMCKESFSQLSYFTGIHKSGWEYEPVDLKSLITDCCDFMADTARNRYIHIDYSDVQTIDLLLIEKGWMKKAILNLLHNACKYSWAGRNVIVSLNEQKGLIYFKVKNIGIGIPEAHKERIFEAYFRSQVEDDHGMRTGTGIGLTIVKNAIEMIHKGKISVTSEPLDKVSGNSMVNVPHQTAFAIRLNRDVLKSQKNP